MGGFRHGRGEGEGVGHVLPFRREQPDLCWRGLRGGVVQQLSKLGCLREVAVFAEVCEVGEEGPVREEDEKGARAWELQGMGEAI